MALKGSAVIELTDVKTGKKEIVKHDNLVTNAVNDILSIDPLNLRLDSAFELRSLFLPVVGKLIEGVVLFEETLEEVPAKYYAPGRNKIVGYSNMEVSPSTDIRRGSMNQTESGKLEDGTGYRFVFDFESSQGNGQISALSLTSSHMGACGYSSGVYNDHAYGSSAGNMTGRSVAFRAIGEEVWTMKSKDESRIASNIVSIDIENNVAYSVVLAAENCIQIHKIALLTDSIGLLVASPFRNKSPELIATITTTEFCKSLYNTNYMSFVDGGDGYIWGFSCGASSVSSTVHWVKIKKEEWSFEEGIWELPVPVFAAGMQTLMTSSGAYYNQCRCLVYNGFVYFMKSDGYGVVIINTENPTDITTLVSEKQLNPVHDNVDGTCWFNVLGDVVYLSGAHIANKTLYPGYPRTQNYYVTGLYGVARPNLRYGPMVFGICAGTNVNVYLRMYIDNSYLATINNLEKPVQKTADKTMKITYILREE